MSKDPRDRNEYFNTEDISIYLKEYAWTMSEALHRVSKKELDKALFFLEDSVGEGRIFVGGNGGSAAISDHLCCDFQKGTYRRGQANLFTHSLVGGHALFSAIANDLGYERTLSFQLEAAGLTRHDVVILISSSGNSPNVIRAAEVAKAMDAKVIGLTGFDGGKLKKMADSSIHIGVDNYGVIEDCHQAIMHVIAQYYFLGKK